MTASKRIAIVALLLTPSVPAAARAAGLSSKTLHRWLRNPAFQAGLDRHRQSELVLVLRQVQAVSEQTFEALLKGLGQRKRRVRLRMSRTTVRPTVYPGRAD